VAGASLELELIGPGGEPVDLWRTLVSHGFAGLPPTRLDEEARMLEATLPIAGRRPRAIRVEEGRAGYARVVARGRAPGAREAESVLAGVRHMLRLEEDLSGFYALVAANDELAWAAQGAGRMLRSPTAFEDVVKTICTTNCSWSATVRMVTALVEELGEAGTHGRAFPTAAAMAEADLDFYRDFVRAGYRGPYLKALAMSVAEGALDLEALAEASADELPDEGVAALLLALPGVGPYAAAHIMMLLGRYSRLVLDSWTRPTYARLTGKKVSDAAIVRRFRRYGRYAGLAFWLFLTRDWVSEPQERLGQAAASP